MNGKKARAIRKLVYGDDFSPRFRKYKWKGPQIEADQRRQQYQNFKRLYKKGVLPI